MESDQAAGSPAPATGGEVPPPGELADGQTPVQCLAGASNDRVDGASAEPHASALGGGPSAGRAAVEADGASAWRDGSPVAAAPSDGGAAQDRAPQAPAAAAEAAATAERAGVGPDHGDKIGETLVGFRTRLDRLDQAIADVAQQISFMPPQVMRLGKKVDALATSIAEVKYRALLTELIRICDLLDQLIHGTPSSDSELEGHHLRNYGVLRTQLRQTLVLHGLSEIPADGAFDPELHKAMHRVPCDDPALGNHIRSVVRPGFWTDRQNILRYAEVEVWCYDATLVRPQSEAKEPSSGEPAKGNGGSRPDAAREG